MANKKDEHDITDQKYLHTAVHASSFCVMKPYASNFSFGFVLRTRVKSFPQNFLEHLDPDLQSSIPRYLSLNSQ